MKLFSVITACVLAATLNLTLSAQTEEALSISFAPLSWKNSIRDLKFESAGKVEEAFIPNGSPGLETSYSGSNPVVFFTESFGADGEIVRIPRGSVMVPEDSKDWIFLFIENGVNQSKDTYRIIPISNDEREFKNDSFKIFNLTEKELAINFDKDRFGLGRGQSRVLSPSSAESRVVGIQMASTDEEGKWQLVYNTTWSHPRGRKVLVFIVDGDREVPKVRKYYQRAP